jgi:teichuronic acid biosynthesis glycosyltransferase TuaC
MRILFVASANNWNNQAAPFIVEQAESLIKLGHKVEFFHIKGKGWLSYYQHIGKLKSFLKVDHFDLIHAHFVWSALVAVFQRIVPVIVTFHGSDLYKLDLRLVSRLFVYPFARHCIVVNNKMKSDLPFRKTSVIPCGIDTTIFIHLDKSIVRTALGLDVDKQYILFSSRFSRPEKNFALAKEAIAGLKKEVEIIEFDGYSREQSALLYSAVDLLLLTSLHEGSPQVIKEALACNCPIVSTDVGDVKTLVGDTDNCYVCTFDSIEICERVEQILANPIRTNGRGRLMKMSLSLPETALKINAVYQQVLRQV